MAFDLDPNYKQVPERIADFKAKYPDGCLRPANPLEPYRVETIGDRVFIVYVAAAHRTPDDPCPGIGTAWEPFPGRTPYTKDSELQNAETSAWGRAVVASLASESKSVASAEDVRNRRAEAEAPSPAQRVLASDEDRQALTERISRLSDDGKRVLKESWAKPFPDGHRLWPLKELGADEVERASRLVAQFEIGDSDAPPIDEPLFESITEPQVTALNVALRKAGHVGDERHGWLSELLGREVRSSKALTKDEASRALDALRPVEGVPA